MMKLSCQEHLLPGGNLVAKWDNARRYGFEAIELRGHGDFVFRDRLPELRAAHRAGVVMPTVCVIMDHFIGDFDKAQRADAIENMKSLLSVVGELDGVGAITPAAYGLHSNYLPPFVGKRTAQQDHRILRDGLGQLGEHAKGAGVTVLFEPLNRYEDHMCNTLADGVSIVRELDHPSVALMADLFHMGIEEANSSKALEDAFTFVKHIHVADSNRYEPGQGQTDFKSIFATLRRLGYGGYMAFECMLKSDAEEALPRSVNYLKGA
jgi:sugar phosphate isomerase/epimerase